MAELFDCSDATQLLTGSRKARQAISQGELIVLPTDTVYGIAADAFNEDAVAALLAAKGRDRQSPPPVLVPTLQAAAALAAHVPTPVSRLARLFWPGPLTIILPSQPALDWDLGETDGTVALRIPNHPVTLEILRETGPLAVSSANLHGLPPATTGAEARAMLGDSVRVILDSGATETASAPSTIIDATLVNESGGVIRVLREGAIDPDELVAASPSLTLEE